uniref:Reverse transcriptase domain-containing protein n=1 Tax=Tanacetum cinerariifolium TaxID=118510 RepID=A0A6L2LBQ2_TANCI|nr:reverse transcriptase domain-containing protein [Tanacetum cinerariifolium]
MRTRSQSCHNSPQQEASPIIVEPLRIELLFLENKFQEDHLPEVLMADNRTVAELLQAPTEGYEDAIIIPEIAAKNFKLKHTVSSEITELKDLVKALLLDKKNQSSAPLKQLSPIVLPTVVLTHTKTVPLQAEMFIETTSKSANFNQGQLHRPQVNQPPAYQAPIPQTQNVSNTDFESYIKANDAILRNMQSQGQRPTIPTSSKVVKQGTEVTKDQVQTQSTAPVQPLVVQSKTQTPISKPVVAPVSTPMPNVKSSIPYPSRRDNERRHLGAMPFSVWEAISLQKLTSTYMTLELADRSVSKPIGIAKDVSFKVGVFHFPADFVVVDIEPDPRVPLILERCFLKNGRALIYVHKGKLTLRIGNEAITYNLDLTVRYSANYNQMTTNKNDVIEMACEEYSQEVLSFSDVTASGNPTPHDDPIVSTMSLTLTPFGDSDFLLFEEADAFLSLEDDPNSSKINPFYYDPEKELKVCEAKTVKSSVDEPLEVELKDLPPHLEYAFLEGDNKLPVIIAKELGDEDKSNLIKDYKPAVQHQRRVNPKIHDVIKKEVEKLLDAGLIYPISDSPWVSPGIFKFSLTFVIRKRQRSPVPTKHLPIDACLSACAMHRALFKGVCWLFSTTRLRRRWKSLWTTSRSLGILLRTASLVLTKCCKGVKTPILVLTRTRAILWSKRALSSAIRILKTGLRYLFAKKDAKERLLRWVLLLQEFNFKVLDTKGAENLAADHLSRLENPYENVLNSKGINETFPLEMLSMVTFRGDSSASWFADFANYHAGSFIVKEITQCNNHLDIQGRRSYLRIFNKWYQSLAEGRLVEQKERELKYLEKIRTLEYYNESYKECIETLKKKLETLQQEKEGVDGKLVGLLTASKDLDNLIESQRSDKNKEGLGYSVVPPPIAQIYSSPKKDLSWTGLPKFADDIVTDYSRPSPTVESTSGDDQNRNSSASENGESSDSILSKPAVKFVKAAKSATTNKVETVKKPSMRYAELYRKPSKKSTVRGSQRNWNNLNSQQLGENFVRKNRACFSYGHFDHLSYNYGLEVKMGRSSPKNNYTHRSMPPRPAIHRPYRPPMRPVRPNIYAAKPKRTSFYKPAHSYNKRPFQETTQDLVAILIKRVQRLKRELKARTPIHKVNRGRSRPVMAWVPKKV